MRTMRQLEAAAVAAYHRGESWLAFWPSISGDLAAIEPWSMARNRKLVARLLALVVAGDVDGHEPIGDGLTPWERDDAKPSDVGTSARCLWQA